MTKPTTAEFIRQVRQETAKVTWPTRKETTISTILVLIMIVMSSFFFTFVDFIIGIVMKSVLGLGG